MGNAEEKDKRRTELEALGYHVIRFDNHDVMKNIGWVKEEIESWIKNHVKQSDPHPPAPFTRGTGS
jgi:very-short-patch-repair endonuclease